MRVLMPLPAEEFDPTEAGVPWTYLDEAGHEVRFATPEGRVAEADERMLDGTGLPRPLRPVLRADDNGREAYHEMSRSEAFRNPLAYRDLEADEFDGVVLPGGHAPGMKRYLESSRIQDLVARHVTAGRPVGAICHGVLVVARSTDRTGKSVLHGRETTALTKTQELSAWAATYPWLGDYYRTYSETVQQEVLEALASPGDFHTGGLALRRDSPENLSRGFTVRDGNYLSARWPGDAHRFGHEFCELLDDV